jgi:hypothetical protein
MGNEDENVDRLRHLHSQIQATDAYAHNAIEGLNRELSGKETALEEWKKTTLNRITSLEGPPKSLRKWKIGTVICGVVLLLGLTCLAIWDLTKRPEATPTPTPIPIDLAVIPIGTILPWQRDAYSTLPSAYKICDGSVVSDSASPLNGTPLPDLRGEFLRGADNMGTGKGSRNVDGGRNPGTLESDSLKNHQHIIPNLYRFSGNAVTFLATKDNALIAGYPYEKDAPKPFEGGHEKQDPVFGKMDDRWVETGSTGGDETRPRNYAVVFVMRIK